MLSGKRKVLFVRVLCASAVRVGVCGVCVCLEALKYNRPINWVGSFCACAVC